MQKTINDISYLQGAYSNFLVSGNKIISFIEAEGINLDLEDDSTQTRIFESYEAFLLAITSKKDDIITMSMSVKVNMGNYILYLKKIFLETEKMELDAEAKKNRLNFIASKILEYEEYASLYEMSVKKHFIIVKEDIKGSNQEALESAEEKMRTKIAETMHTMKEAMAQANKNIRLELMDAAEIINLLRTLMDNKSVIYV